MSSNSHGAFETSGYETTFMAKWCLYVLTRRERDEHDVKQRKDRDIREKKDILFYYLSYNIQPKAFVVDSLAESSNK